MSDRPGPLVPIEVDLRGFEFMPLFGDRLFASKTWIRASAEAKVAALRLWWHAYGHELPAASLPNDDQLLAEYAGYGVAIEPWMAIRPKAMRGWVICSDDRWYLPWLAEIAVKAWGSSQKYLRRTNRRLQIESLEWSELRAAVFARDDYTCRYCGNRGERLECDHVTPVVRGGATVDSNLVTACLRCNRSKGRKTLDEWCRP